VLDFFRMPPGTSLGDAHDKAPETCQKEIPPQDYGYDPSVYEAAAWVGNSGWNSGTRFVVCTAIRQDRGTMEKDEP
jgi:hypothetical protein